jgi:hypothetical protein
MSPADDHDVEDPGFLIELFRPRSHEGAIARQESHHDSRYFITGSDTMEGLPDSNADEAARSRA